MGWNNQGGGGPWGGGGNGGGPWGGSGGGPRGGRGGGRVPTPPDLDELLRKSQEKVRDFLPGAGGKRGIGLAALAVVAIWALTGFYRVQTNEQGIELLFGKYVNTTNPGLNYWFPAPIGEVYRPNVTQVNEVQIGFRGAVNTTPRPATAGHDVAQESLMLTGDQNIIDINFVVQWVIKDAAAYLFNIRDPEDTVRAAAESAMREVIGSTTLENALSKDRVNVDIRTKTLLQNILDGYGAGIAIQSVKTQKIDAPQAVIDAFNDVQRAKQDQERLQNEATRYLNDIVPRAKGEAEKMIQDATAYKERLIREADGEAQRFLSVFDEYRVAKDVTMRRMYLERMQQILSRADKVIIDPSAKGGSGVVPYLPLPEVRKKAQGGQQ